MVNKNEYIKSPQAIVGTGSCSIIEWQQESLMLESDTSESQLNETKPNVFNQSITSV